MTKDLGNGVRDKGGDSGPGGNGRHGQSCPEADLLAGLVDGHLLPAERERLERHVDACDACRGLVAAIARQADRIPAPRALVRRRGTRTIIVAAAAALLAVGVWSAWYAWREPPSERDQAAAVFGQLEAEAPKLFTGVALLSDAELAVPSPVVARGGVTLLAPVGAVLDDRPAVRWEKAAGITAWVVLMLTDDLRELWRLESATNAVDYPSDADALPVNQTYIVRVEGHGPGGPVDVEQAFRTASPAARDAFTRRAAAIEGATDAGVRDLALAHAALAQNLLAEAERAARRHCAAHPQSRLGHATLRHVLRRIGSREAESVRMPGRVKR